MKKNKSITVISYLVFGFLFIPLLIIVITSFGTQASIQFPIKGFTLDWYSVVFHSASFIASFKISLITGVLATLIAALVGVPAAYALNRDHFKYKESLNSFFLSPSLIPGMVIGYMIYNMIIIQLHLPVIPALIIGHMLISLPYIIRVVGSNIQNLDESIEEASWTLGYTQTQTFFKIVLPNITSGIFAGSLLSFVNSFNNIPVSMFLTGPGVTTLPITLLSYLEYNYNPAVSAISTLLMLLTIVLMYLIDKTLGLSSIM
ncbi:hypothetical protein HMPREF9318_00375 [Streptococcus urinalis FB127-CNA-2]|uniref:ABC transporter, permease protein n=1 Tax=Streptococcus urinalis 2285-97 TaxID=764291 RepID=G5KFW7_9STRE|nr:ABC transporter permease [Streptococcus urinalis]EHJ57582.1 ABC transporter, permease protein [Streptococcus urinalis 2285-97]EKS22177.1 hypothetical protein HMPREF9318_00375 [Streptococcus urinalis FB127-CNA-2]VEF31989.1 spermidine/putrescine ABC transporter permease [Streptococcus urinalis]